MAGKLSAKGAVIAVDDSAGAPQTISADCESYEIQWAHNPEEVTGFGQHQNFVPGLFVAGLTLNVMWNTTATTGATTVIKGIIGNATSKTVSVTPEAGGLAFSGEFMCDGMTVGGAASGGKITLGSVHFSPMGAVAPTFA